MDKFEYFSGIPEVGIVPRAPHAGPLLQHVYEQEHGRGGFAGKVSHTYHLIRRPTGCRRRRGCSTAAPGRRTGNRRCARWAARITRSAMAEPPAPRDVYRGMARLVANATVAMNVTAPAASMDYFFEHHSATLVFFVHEGGGTLETTFGPIDYGKRRLPHRAQGHHAPLRARARGPSTTGCTSRFAGDPEKGESPTTGRFITHSQSDYRFPRTLDTRNEAGRFEIVSKVGRRSTRGACTRPIPSTWWAGAATTCRTSFAVEDVRPLTADRSHVPPSGHTIFKLPGCYLCVFTVRSRRSGKACGCPSSTEPRLPARPSAITTAISSARAG